MMRSRIRWPLTVILLLLLGLTPVIATENTPQIHDYTGYHLNEINRLRADLGLPPFAYNENLAAAAHVQAEWMIANWSYAHVHGGSTPRTRALDAGYASYEWCCTENTFISANQTPEAALNFWIRSAPHYAQLTSTDYDEIGVGYAIGSARTGQVIVFGKRALNPTVEAASITQECASQYIVRPGDTLLAISRRHNVAVNLIVSANSIANRNLIYVGDSLCIPGSSSVPATITGNHGNNATSSTAQHETTPAIDNWCYAGGPWGDGRCNAPDPAERQRLWECGWYKARGIAVEGC